MDSGNTLFLQQTNGNGVSHTETGDVIIGCWFQADRGNGAKIWYEFYPDKTFTFNYDMMGNRDNVMNRGNWIALGNFTYELISDIPAEPGTHGNEHITLNGDKKSFISGNSYSISTGAATGIIFLKE